MAQGNARIETLFKHEDDIPSLPYLTKTRDLRVSQLERFETTEYEKREFLGLPTYRKNAETNGIQEATPGIGGNSVQTAWPTPLT